MVNHYGFSPDKVRLIPNGSEINRFYPDLYLRKNKRDQLGIKDDEIVILYTGKISERKGVDKIILSTQKYIPQFNIRYLFVGNIDQEFKERFEKIIENIKDIVLLFNAVPNSDLPDFYRISDIACWPMESSMSAIDAMACGLPIIVCDQLKERLKNRNGIGIKEGDIKELENAIYRLISNDELRREMGRRGRELVEKEMNWKAISQKFIEIGICD